jgi:hypothetical protein
MLVEGEEGYKGKGLDQNTSRSKDQDKLPIKETLNFLLTTLATDQSPIKCIMNEIFKGEMLPGRVSHSHPRKCQRS